MFQKTATRKKSKPPRSRDAEIRAMDRMMAIEAEYQGPPLNAVEIKPLDAAFRQDIETLLGVAERVYHLPGGRNGKGAVGQACARVRQRLGGLP